MSERDLKTVSTSHWPLFGALGLAVIALIAVAFARITDIGTVRVQTAAPEAVREVRVARAAKGELILFDAASNARIGVIDPVADEAAHKTVVSLAAGRKVRNVPQDKPFRVVRWSTGMVTLTDTGTGQRTVISQADLSRSDAITSVLAQ